MKPFRFIPLLLAIAISTWCGFAQAKSNQLPAACQALITKTFFAWKPVVPAADVVAWSKSQKFNPVIAVGDFDGNGQRDWATIGADGKNGKVVLCLSQGKKVSLAVAEDDGCTDLIYSLRVAINTETIESPMLRRFMLTKKAVPMPKAKATGTKSQLSNLI